ncbi:hypothetical protein AA313_de0201060 [Arthrobotrys entomopaga]|nr:hypothetical protein AA313_de0201060 [Arthrobotrys entomopaga]
MVKIQVVSDLHLESPSAYDIFELEPTAPYLALLGDIGNTRDPGLLDFLRRMLKQYDLVFFVPGNHEPYHSSWPATTTTLSEFANSINNENLPGQQQQQHGKFIFMDQTRHDITPTVSILGCTLFSAIDPKHTHDVSYGLNDFYYIKNWTSTDHNARHASDVSWLNTQVEKIAREEPERKIVVLTHYCPTFDANDPQYEGSKLTSGFTTDMTGEVCWTSCNVAAWAFGHTHFNYDVVDGSTGKRVVANQRGYTFAQADLFDAGKTLEV